MAYPALFNCRDPPPPPQHKPTYSSTPPPKLLTLQILRGRMDPTGIFISKNSYPKFWNINFESTKLKTVFQPKKLSSGLITKILCQIQCSNKIFGPIVIIYTRFDPKLRDLPEFWIPRNEKGLLRKNNDPSLDNFRPVYCVLQCAWYMIKIRYMLVFELSDLDPNFWTS